MNKILFLSAAMMVANLNGSRSESSSFKDRVENPPIFLLNLKKLKRDETLENGNATPGRMGGKKYAELRNERQFPFPLEKE